MLPRDFLVLSEARNKYLTSERNPVIRAGENSLNFDEEDSQTL